MKSVLPQLETELARRAETDADPRPARSVRSQRTRQLALLAAGAGVFFLLALLSPLADRGRLDVVAEARAALDPGRSIIHTVSIRRTGPQPEGSYVVLADGTKVTGRFSESQTERWSTLRPLRYRERSTESLDGRRLGSRESAYAGGRFTQVQGGRLITNRPSKAIGETLLELTRMSGALAPAGPFPDDPVRTLRSLLATGRIRPDGERTLNGRRVVRLVPADPAADRRAARAVGSDPGFVTPTEYLVDAEDYAPVRVTYRFSMDRGAPASPQMTTTITFETYERLDPTPTNEALLTIDPAGREVVEKPTMFTGKKVRPGEQGKKPG